jgi:hypothetical protein
MITDAARKAMCISEGLTNLNGVRGFFYKRSLFDK